MTAYTTETLREGQSEAVPVPGSGGTRGQEEETQREYRSNGPPASFGSQAAAAPNDRPPSIETDTSLPVFPPRQLREDPAGRKAGPGRDAAVGARTGGRGGRGERRQERFRNERPTWEELEHVGRLSTASSGWTREVNIVSWNGAAPRLDIRDWSPDRMKMSRGIGLNREETENLRALLNSFDPRQAGI